MSEKTKVLFRYWEDSVIAIFPQEAATQNPYYCLSYQHIGQHGTCSPHSIIYTSRPAKPSEYRKLASELRKLGYKLDIQQRITQQDFDLRRKQGTEAR